MLLCVLVGCAQGTKENRQFGDYPDAGMDAAAGGDALPMPDAAASCVLARAVYLNFTGVTTLTQGASSDATHDVAAWMNKANGTAPIFRAGSGTRDADIAAITAGIMNALSPFHVQVVTTRPAAGPYQEIIFGGTPAQVGSNFSGAVQKLDCGNQVLNDVAWIGDSVTPNQAVINFALGAVGFGVGLTATTTTTDCMCGWDNTCAPNFNQACSFSASIARDGTANQTCAGVTDQNEPAALMNAFCQ
ncbi:hypothetical protein BH11MYX2_BH11MYX2_37950 [soil metagenome]